MKHTNLTYVSILALATALVAQTAPAQNPVLIKTIDLPVWGQSFLSVTGDKWLIGDPWFDPTGPETPPGVAYLIDSNGNLLNTLTNPAPEVGRGFGWAATMVGTNLIAVAASQFAGGDPSERRPGAVYLYDLDGNLVRAFSNPDPVGTDAFGTQITALGANKLVVSTGHAWVPRPDRVFLFDTNGTRMATFPPSDFEIVNGLGAVGSDRVLIDRFSEGSGVAEVGLVDATGSFLTNFIMAGPPLTPGLQYAVFGDNRVLLADRTQPGATLYDLKTGLDVSHLANPGIGASFPWSIVSLSGDRVLLTDDAGEMFVYDATGNLLGGILDAPGGAPPLATIPVPNDRFATISFWAGGVTATIFSVPPTTPGPPVVLRQPSAQTNDAGTTATFSVLAAGPPPLTYSWFKDGAPLSDDAEISGAHMASLTLNNVNGADSGAYAVAVNNASGSVTSVVATLTVLDPILVNRSFPRAVPLGSTLVLSAEAAGTAPLTYVWTKNGNPIAAGTGSTFTILNAQLSDSGEYNVTVTNAFGRDAKEPLLVAVTAAYADDFDPQPVFVAPGPSRLPASVDALAIQRDGKILAGGTFSELYGRQKYYLARINNTGGVDTAFSPFVQSPIDWIGLTADGRVAAGESSLNSFFPALYRFLPNGLNDSTFTNPLGLPPSVLRVLQPDGRIVLATQGGPDLVVRRLNSDGFEDAAFSLAFFDPPFGSQVSCLALQRDGKILVAGNFQSVGGEPRASLARLNADGSLDMSFHPSADWGAGPGGGWIESMAVQSDGKILITGGFTSISGNPSDGIARLNSSGTLDPSFTASLPHWGPGIGAFSIALQADGKIILGGNFDTLSGQSVLNLGRLNPDGSVDLSFAPSPDGEVLALALQPDGRLLVGGNFTTLAGAARPGFGRLINTDSAAQSLTRQGSTVTWLRGASSTAFWHATFDTTLDGATWTSIGSATPVPGGWQVTGVSAPDGATIRARGYVVCGKFNASSWVVESIIGSPAIVTQPASRTNNAGSTATFSVEVVGEAPFTYQWRKDGLNLSDAGNISGSTTATLTLTNVLFPDSGDYTVVVANSSGSRTSVVAHLTVRDPWIGSSMYTPWVVQNLPDPGNRLTVGISPEGTKPFTFQWRKNGQIVPGATASTLVISNAQISDSGRYEGIVSNTYGSATGFPAYVTVVPSRPEAALNPGAQFGPVLATAVQPDGSLIVGGSFTRLSGASRANLGRLTPNGTLDTSFGGFGQPPDGTVRALAVQPDGKILVGGDFQKLVGNLVSPPPPAALGRLKPDGTMDSSFNARIAWFVRPGFVTTVNALALQADGKILVGGNFTNAAGQARGGFARLNPDGALDPSFAASAGTGTGNPFGDVIQALVVQPDGKILVGGRFASFGGEARQNLARLNSDGTLDTGFNLGPGSVSNLAASVYTMILQPDGKILVGGVFDTLAGQPRTNLARLNSDGTLDPSFQQRIIPANRPIRCLALQADSKILVGGRFQNWDGAVHRFGRLNADGTPDTTFLNDVTQPLLVDQGEDVYMLSLQNDGRLVVAGRFTQLSGSQFNVNNLGRLPAVAAPTDQLLFGGGKVTWLRGGASPDVWRVTFEQSNDGVAWSLLGVGTRIAGGWQLDGVSLPKGTLARARGSVMAGGANDWLVQKVATVPDLPPVADASATLALLISPNGTNTTVILDGSRSSDPDGDALQFAWYESGSLLTEGAVAVKVMPVGLHPIRLVVSDGELSATNVITVEIVTTAQAAERLQAAARDGVARSQPLLASLSAAIASIDRSNPVSAINQLLAFQNKVQAQVAPMDPALAQALIQSAQQVIDALSSSQANAGPQPHGRFNLVRKQPDGKVRMEFQANPDGVYIIEASTDLVHWEPIGVGSPLGGGTMAFEDKPTRGQARKFYRVVRFN